MAVVEYWIQLENHAWDVSPKNIDRLTGHNMQQITGNAPAVVTITSPVTGVAKSRTMYRPMRTSGMIEEALILRRYTPNWAAPDDRKVNPWDLNEPDPTDNGTLGTIPGPTIECNVGDTVKVRFRNKDSRVGKDVKSRTHSLHPHGFVFANTYDGAYPLSPPDPTQPVSAGPVDETALWAAVGVTDHKKGDRVPPGAIFEYTWETLGWPTTAGVWLYHDHSICDTHNVELGAIGIIVIHNPADPDDVINPDLPGGSHTGSPVRHVCFPFPFVVRALPHELNRFGLAAHPIAHELMMGGIETHKEADERREKKGGKAEIKPEFVVKRGDLLLELDPDFKIIKRLCLPFYREPPGNAQYLQLFHNLGHEGMCINGRKYMGNTPTMVAGENTKMRFGVVGMGNIDGFHTFHIHGHRWIIPGPDGNTPAAIQSSPQVTAVSQFEDTRTFGPANSFSFTINPRSFMRPLPPGLGEWHMHCHVLTHMMDGMMGSLLVINGGELAFGLPTGEPCPTMEGGGHDGGGGMGMEVKVKDFFFDPVNVTVSAGQTVTWKWEVATTHTITSDTGIWDSGTKSGMGTTFPRAFPSPGVFSYHCQLHGSPGGGGMSGTVTVI